MTCRYFFLASLLALGLVSCDDSGAIPGNDAIAYPEFLDEAEVVIHGYDADAMEPFITKDGRYLFFNSLNDGIDTSLYYAVKTDDANFNILGRIQGVNGSAPHLDAVASMDEHGRFYFVSTRRYPDIFENFQTGEFLDGTVTGVRPVEGDFYIRRPGWIIMDAEIRKDGNALYYVNAHFSGTAFPDEARLGLAEKSGSVFLKTPPADFILGRIADSNYLIYAPSISSDGKELYFTRVKKGTLISEICVSVRADVGAAFSAPRKIGLSGEAVEAPSLTDDGARLYYHKKLARDGKYHIFTIQKKSAQ